MFGLTNLCTYSIAFFLPIILNTGLGFSVGASQCLGAPPAVVAAIVGFIYAWYSDKWRLRSPFVIFNGCLGLLGGSPLCQNGTAIADVNLLGFGLLGYTRNNGVRYFGVFLANIAGNANVPCVLTWQANNIRGQWKRAFCSASLVGCGGLGGIIASTVYRQQDKPAYHPGILTTMIGSALIVVIASSLDVVFYTANKRIKAGAKSIENLPGFLVCTRSIIFP